MDFSLSSVRFKYPNTARESGINEKSVIRPKFMVLGNISVKYITMYDSVAKKDKTATSLKPNFRPRRTIMVFFEPILSVSRSGISLFTEPANRYKIIGITKMKKSGLKFPITTKNP